MDEKLALVAEFGLSADTLEFNLDDFSVEELRTKLEDIKSEREVSTFALAQQIHDELLAALRVEQVETEWGSMYRYCYCDHDAEASEVYCYDCKDDGNLYGFNYSMNGDSAVIDFDTRKRKKFSIVDFDLGEQPSPIVSLFKLMDEQVQKMSEEWSAQSQKQIDALNSELNELRNFKNQIEESQAKANREAVFAQFEDLAGVEAFEQLRQSCNDGTVDFSVSELEDKCFSIRGRQGFTAKFSSESTPCAPKLKVTHDEHTDEPYGGVFKKYGY